MKQKSAVKFFYLRDQKDPRRVLTVARALVKGKKHTKVEVGWAVSRPTQKDEFGYEIEKGDQFCKERGRTIATGRMEKCPIRVTLENGETPLRAALTALASSEDTVPRRVRQMAQTFVKANPVVEVSLGPNAQTSNG